MRIVIDLQGAQTESKFRGIGRYSLAIAQAIVRNRGEHEIIIALSGLFPETIEPIRAAFEGILSQENIRVWYAPGPVRELEPNNESRRMVAELIREAFLASLNPDVIFITSLFEGYVDDAITSIGVLASKIPTVVILYDLIPLLHHEAFLDHNPFYKQHYSRKIEYFKKADRFFAISESSAQEAINALGISEDLITNISSACDQEIFRIINIDVKVKDDLLQKFNIKRPFIMYCSGIDYTKNIHNFILAYSKLSQDIRNMHQLVIAGRIAADNIDELYKFAESVGIHIDELVFAGYVTDEELSQLYNLCKLFVLPSIHEGFGLPALEAMSCGVPVIGSNATSIPEVIGLDEALFDPLDPGSIAAKITSVLTDKTLLNLLRDHAAIQAEKFSWDRSACCVINSFELAYNKSKVSDNVKVMPESWLSMVVEAIAINSDHALSTKYLCDIAAVLAINFPLSSRKKTLFLDISELVQRDAKTGIQRVVRSILKELMVNPPDGYIVQPVYATGETQGYFYASKFVGQFLGIPLINIKDELVDACTGDIFLGLDLQHHVVLAQKDFLLEWRRRGVKIFFVIYDLLPILLPQFFHNSIQALHQSWLECISHFDGAMCISNSVADEFKIWLNTQNSKQVRPFKIDWFHLGSDVENSVTTTGMPDNSNLMMQQITYYPTFIMVSTVEPRKGYVQTIKAFEQLWRDGCDINLVIIGKQGWMSDEFFDRLHCHPKLEKHLFWLKGISDEYLERIYATSTCLIAASEGEGFGLPLIEAARHKLPIIARDIPVFREVAGEHAFYFNGKEPDDLAEAIKNWLILYSKKQHPRSDDMPWLAWKESAKSLIDKLCLEKK